MSRTIHIFGDSFLADWTKNKKPFPLCQDYIDWEKTQGNHTIEDVSYWMTKYYSDTIRNFSKGGTTNESIFDQFETKYDKISSGDFVIIQGTLNTRLRAMRKDGQAWLGPVIFGRGVDQRMIDKVDRRAIFKYKFYQKLAMERLENKWTDFLLEKIDFYRKILKQKEVNLCFLSLDPNMKMYNDIPAWHWDNSLMKEQQRRISDISPIKDSHPSYYENKQIAAKIITYIKKIRGENRI